MLTLMLNANKTAVQMLFRDFLTEEFQFGTAFDLNEAKKIGQQLIDIVEDLQKKEEKMAHKKIMIKAAKALDKDAKHYAKEAKQTKSKSKKKEELVEKKEAKSASKDLKKRAKKAHE